MKNISSDCVVQHLLNVGAVSMVLGNSKIHMQEELSQFYLVIAMFPPQSDQSDLKGEGPTAASEACREVDPVIYTFFASQLLANHSLLGSARKLKSKLDQSFWLANLFILCQSLIYFC